jgi:hypothetical protein
VISSGTKVHTAIVLVAVALVALAGYAGVLPDSTPAAGGIALLFWGVVLGGSHLYLAVRGGDGSVPVRSRWRYLGALAALLGLTAVGILGAGRTVGPVRVDTVTAVLGVLVAVAYLVVASLEGYRSSRE